MTVARKSIHVGTSGWNYGHWKGPFYPEKLPDKDFLPFYTRRLPTVEINNTFYRLPQKAVVRHWRDQVPDDFIFSVKASRYITHVKRLKDPEKSLAKFFDVVVTLENKLGPILFQLPPRWNANFDRLATFLDSLPRDEFTFVFEFRDHSWLTSEVYDLLTEHHCSFCMYELSGFLAPKIITADTVYLRLHGPDGAYAGKYSYEDLAGWAGAITQWARMGKQVFCYFDNDQSGFAVQNAQDLSRMVHSEAREHYAVPEEAHSYAVHHGT